MSMPGFTAEFNLTKRSASYRGVVRERVAGRQAVVAAAPSCDVCDSVCERYPDSAFCQSCYDNCLP